LLKDIVNCPLSKIRILAFEEDAMQEEILRITIDKLSYNRIDSMVKPAGQFLKISVTQPDIRKMIVPEQ